MDKTQTQIITLVFIVLILLFLLDHISVSLTNSMPTTTKNSSNAYIYRQPTTTTIYATTAKSNPYKAQYYN
jgi:hypothetical protein